MRSVFTDFGGGGDVGRDVGRFPTTPQHGDAMFSQQNFPLQSSPQQQEAAAKYPPPAQCSIEAPRCSFMFAPEIYFPKTLACEARVAVFGRCVGMTTRIASCTDSFSKKPVAIPKKVPFFSCVLYIFCIQHDVLLKACFLFDFRAVEESLGQMWRPYHE